MPGISYLNRVLALLLFLLSAFCLYAQQDSAEDKGIDSFLLKRHGLAGKLARSIFRDTAINDASPVRNDLLFRRYQGRVIRSIEIYVLDFGTPISDTTQK